MKKLCMMVLIVTLSACTQARLTPAGPPLVRSQTDQAAAPTPQLSVMKSLWATGERAVPELVRAAPLDAALLPPPPEWQPPPAASARPAELQVLQQHRALIDVALTPVEELIDPKGDLLLDVPRYGGGYHPGTRFGSTNTAWIGGHVSLPDAVGDFAGLLIAMVGDTARGCNNDNACYHYTVTAVSEWDADTFNKALRAWRPPATLILYTCTPELDAYWVAMARLEGREKESYNEESRP